MKKYKLLFNFIVIALLLQTCREEESIQMGKVQFAFNASALNSPGGRTKDLEPGSLLVISIIKSNGDPVLTLKELNLIKFGDQYMSEPIQLADGNYSITDFMIASLFGEVYYATPKEGSPVAEFVEHPLPIPFSVSENETTDLAVEVVSVYAYQPDDFGYVSFEITVLPTQILKLSVFVPAENGLESTGAQAYVLHDSDTIFNQYLPPGTNSIQVEEDVEVDDEYTLVLIEPAYKKYSRTFILQELWNELAGFKPMAVTLTPALTFITIPDQSVDPSIFSYNQSVHIEVTSPSSILNLVVDWGDGSIEEIPNEYFENRYIATLPNHDYTTNNPYFVSISGDLEFVTSLSMFYGSRIVDISLKQLPELNSFGMGACLTPATIDFSHNKKLEGANLAMGTFEFLDISGNPLFKHLNLSFNGPFSAESLNQLIHVFLQRATEQNVTRGEITMMAESPNDVVGPPSEAAKQELRILRDTYDWEIYPDPDDY